MCPHRESGELGAGQNADRQMDHGGRGERHCVREEPPLCSVFRDVLAYVSCRGYAGIPQSARRKARIKVAPRVLLVLDNFCQGRFLFP